MFFYFFCVFLFLRDFYGKTREFGFLWNIIYFFKKNAKFIFLKKTEKLYNPSNETCKKLANSEACFSISFKVKGSPIPVKGISRFDFNFKKRVLS